MYEDMKAVVQQNLEVRKQDGGITLKFANDAIHL